MTATRTVSEVSLLGESVQNRSSVPDDESHAVFLGTWTPLCTISRDLSTCLAKTEKAKSTQYAPSIKSSLHRKIQRSSRMAALMSKTALSASSLPKTT